MKVEELAREFPKKSTPTPTQLFGVGETINVKNATVVESLPHHVFLLEDETTGRRYYAWQDDHGNIVPLE